MSQMGQVSFFFFSLGFHAVFLACAGLASMQYAKAVYLKENI